VSARESADRALRELLDRSQQRADQVGEDLLRLAGPEPGSAGEQSGSDEAVWERCGAILREKDPETYRQLSALTVSLAAMCGEPVPAN